MKAGARRQSGTAALTGLESCGRLAVIRHCVCLTMRPLERANRRGLHCEATETRRTHLEAFVLQDFLDGNVLLVFGDAEELGLEDDAKGTVPDDFAIGILDVPRVATLSIGRDNLDDF